ncbi:SDR family oxidoreductase [Vibrio parahaemolyticus]|uniref:NAD-dependent epimerase/dehydratase n=2 Tax=Vibrio parahaemolyticus TaxID=670 RepID=A0A5P1PNR5_VIBPH|nr:SDR family oxidoreductase [Vibrio parahaemolyticus]AMG05822.1 hypothetical protein AL464_02685 [Vibrio parahaemolyticus]EGR0425065.1 SDR family oxidoreductase [Vibrio parahaemolyticus]EJG0782604.1 SDR family oxidoreductase [Vibrio parahaemolyticus]EJG1590448.1 SDR family oxidoreductase [Vibrio parahaemolyticus]EJH2590006.1 SDR family oxidoreductase [Vibrio parahaemolyticus]
MSNIKNIAVLGGAGLLGKPLVSYLRGNGFNVTSYSKSSPESDYNIDVVNHSELITKLDELRPDLIINLVALTNVDSCEENVALAYEIHVKVNQVLSDYCSQRNKKIIHLSTDHFYDGYCSKESDTYPQNVYGLTKLMGEKEFKDNDSVILRTNFFGKSITQGRKSITDVMYESTLSGKDITLFNDVYFSPLSIDSLCKVIAHVILHWKSGIYNLGSKNGMSKENFVLQFLEQCGIHNISYESVSIKDSNIKVIRPKDMRMDVELFESTYGYDLPNLINEIKTVAGDYNEEKV